MYDVTVIGAGASGLMAAVTAAEYGAKVLVIEKNEKTGKKLYITGKGRCNVTNACDRDSFFRSVLRNPKFLMSSFSQFDNNDCQDFFERNGLKLKTERGERVFPVSDKSNDVIQVFNRLIKKHCITVVFGSPVRNVVKTGTGFRVSTDSNDYDSVKVIVATGGLSYPSTGSTGDGYKFAKKTGHSVTELYPALVPFNSPDQVCSELQGVSLKNVSLKLYSGSRLLYNELGELLFTHFGVSGPLVLSASSRVDTDDFSDVRCVIDLKPGLDEETLDRRILRDFEKYRNKIISNALSDLLISRLVLPVIERSGIAPDKFVHEITKAERQRLLETLKNFTVRVSGLRNFDEAIITRGGIDIKEINPKTMESKKTDGLYFCGEVLDLDAETGGFNLQIAFSTGYAAGYAGAVL